MRCSYRKRVILTEPQMMKMGTYPCQSRHTYLTLLIFAALTVFGHAQLDGDVSVDNDGLVKVYGSNTWTTVCVSGDFTIQSRVLCRSFGQKYFNYFSSKRYLSGRLRRLQCRGDENSISACTNYYFSYYGCSYDKLHVQCQEDTTKAFCPFDNDNCGMITEGTENYKWQRVHPYKSLGWTGQSAPKHDHTTKSNKGKYMLASAAGFPGDKAILKTKPFFGNINSVSFYYHMFGRKMGSLNVYIQTNNSSKKSIGSISGDQGKGWKHMCLPVNKRYGHHEIIFEAVLGEDFDCDIALDDLTLSENSCSNHWNVSCDFTNDTCGYDIQNNGNIDVGWRLYTNKYYGNSSSGSYLQFNSYYYSKIRHFIKSPIINVPKEKMIFKFRYLMPGTASKELQIRFVKEGLQSWFTKTPYYWQDSGDHGSEWQDGCMDLPSENGSIIIIGFAGYRYSTIGLDDLIVDKGYCLTGITNHMCTFDNPLLCEYEITCMNPNEYTWRRKKGSTSSSYTGPSGDSSRLGNGHYIYAEASNGMFNDTTSLTFPISNTTKGKKLKFNYNMYGSYVGALYVVFITKNQLTNQSSSKEIVWTRKGNQGTYWHVACLHIEYDLSEIIFVAVRGYSYEGDIAIDNVVVEEKGCPGPFDCNFEEGKCRYNIYGSYFSWYYGREYLSYSYSNRYIYLQSRTNYEGRQFQIQSPQAEVKENSSITFKYKLKGKMKNFALITYDYYSRNEIWSSNFNDIPEFITACVNFPNSTKFGLIFQGTTSINSRWNGYTYLDNIEVHNETCKLGLTYHFCKFREIHRCNFQVECPENTKYNWSRGYFTYYRDIPRFHRYSYDEEYYMYTDSLYGKPGHRTHLTFSNVVPPTGYNLFFDFYLQQGSGKLQVDLETSGRKKRVFEEFGVAQSSVWQSACVPVTKEQTNIEFIATQGYGIGQYIGVTNVGFLQKECQDSSISCDFSKGTCQYNNLNYYSSWERIHSGNYTYLTNGFYMKTTLSYYSESMWASPTENITNSCLQFRYKIINKNCKLTVYNAYNNNTILSLVSEGTTEWRVAQVYVWNETTKLVFQAKNARYDICEVLLDYVNTSKHNCSELVCPAGTRKCKNSYCYSESKVCDRVKDCSDGSDEMNCSTSITCNFTTKYYCGYKSIAGWQLALNNNTSFYAPGSMQITRAKGKLLSPVETLEYSCVNFQYITTHALTGSFSVHPNYWNPSISHHGSWNENFFSQRDGIYKGQLQLSAGKGFLTFTADIKSGGLAIDSVTIINGTCPELNCSKNSHKCSDNSKCVDKKNLCNNYNNCVDGSDEANCPEYFRCDFEDSNMCGFTSYPENAWGIRNGIASNIPSLDHSEGTYEGQYIISDSSEESNVTAPKITTEDVFCFNFHYVLYGNGTVSVYDNDTFLMSLSRFDYDMWRGVNITLPKGIHNIHFVYSKGNSTSGAMALDSVSIIPGRCLHKSCEENWYPCNNNVTCYSFSEKCDGTKHCPNGEDEYGCTGKKREYKLTYGRTLWSGRVAKLYGSEYIPVCESYLSDKIVNEICSELGANATTTQTYITTYITGNYYDYYHYYYYYYNNPWNVYSCTNECYCSTTYVTCSNTTCEDGEVRCPPGRNETNSTNVCIRKESMCDGELDCEDGTDEKNCATCAKGLWRCRNLKCINQGLRCDGKKDCDDGSDEFRCFTYINKTIQVYYNGSYKNICEDNFKDEKIANQLCSFVGRSNGTLGNSIEGYGVQFTQDPSGSNTGLIPGYKANSFEKCKYMVVECSEQVCGTRKRDLFEPNVQNGQDALPGEWPAVAELLRGSYSICTATLISQYYVLTAAHCVDDHRYYNYSVRVGSVKRGEGKLYSVTHVLLNDNYEGYLYGYDLALLYVKSGIAFTDDVQPACLPENPAPLGRDYYVIGWGQDENRRTPSILQEAKTGILEFHKCKEFYNINDAVICSNNKEFYQPICYGDSGGPLLTLNDKGFWTIHGVSSFGAAGCRGDISNPGAFSSVFHGVNWVKKFA